MGRCLPELLPVRLQEKQRRNAKLEGSFPFVLHLSILEGSHEALRGALRAALSPVASAALLPDLRKIFCPVSPGLPTCAL